MFDRLVRKSRAKKVRKAIAGLRAAKVEDILTRYLITINRDETIIAAATKMIAEDVSCLLVMSGNQLEGILTERDFLRKVPLNKKVFKMKVKDIMTPSVVTVAPEVPLTEAVAIMKKENFRRLVVAEGETVVGLITQTDLSRKVAELFSVYPVLSGWAVETVMVKPSFITNKDSFNTAKEKMRKTDLAAVVIRDKKKGGNVQGILSEYDFVMQFYDQQRELDVNEVSSFTRKYVRAIDKGTHILEANRLLLDNKIHRFPIVVGSEIVGVFTQKDMVRFIYSNLDALEDSLEDKKTGFLVFWKGKRDGEFRSEKLKVYATPCSRLL